MFQSSYGKRDIDRAQRVVAGLKADTVWINGWAALSDSYEEGGMKRSGLGRLRGPGALAEFQETKTVIQIVDGVARGHH